MEMTLLLLLCVGSWAQEQPAISAEALQSKPTPNETSDSLVTENSETAHLTSVNSSFTLTRAPEENGSASNQTTQNPTVSTPHIGIDEASPRISIDAGTDLPASVSTTPQEISTKAIVFLEISKPTNNTAPDSLDLHTVTGEAMATTSLEPTDGTSGLPVTMTTHSLEPTSGASGPPVTMATSSLDTSSRTSGPLVTMATSSPDTSSGTSGFLVTMTTSFEETSNGITGSPTSRVKIAPVTASKTSPTSYIRSRSPYSSEQGPKSIMLVPVLVALLVVIVLVALLLLRCRRRNQRTGVPKLTRVGKRNGVVDTWAGPAPVSDEEAMTPASVAVAGDDKSSGEPEIEGPGRRPTLITFFGRRKSCQGSIALEELKAGSDPGVRGEGEPLVGSEEETVSDGSEVGEVEASD
ncbi:leukosialin [Talpa occidentalis]|uniref:leukosialin n=1 Tax=Talpa occidentalis TaxID=50954 RepID=UPI0018900E3C|nr:leukosialin [Talpa occidentalis]